VLPKLVLAAIVGLVLSAPRAQAEIAVMESGKILYIDRFERVDEDITLFLTGGGEVRVPSDLVANIVPNEIVQEQGADPVRVRLLPHLESVIQPAAAKYGLDPNLVAAVIWAESSGDPNAVSKKGARGLMQLMPATARELGVDNVFDPGQNVDGGSRYLRRMLDEHDGDLSLALAAYNAGPNAVRRYGGVPPYRETRDYVGRVLRVYERAKEAD
jgi:soluble lytic murein transglycosylase-like protein